MILSASRRTDIPAFYPDWFYNRLTAGFVLTPNPMNPDQISRIALDPATVDCIVFWTKNPAPLLPGLSRLREYAYYFQFTLTPYGSDLEPDLPDKAGIFETFRRLSGLVGPQRVIWRYDPILATDQYPLARHEQLFADCCHKLRGYTEKCVISFYDSYRKSDRRLAGLGARILGEAEMISLARSLAAIARDSGLILESCAEALDLQDYGINHGHCIDRALIEQIICCPLDVDRDRNQRPECGCAASIDIGSYNTCPHGCRYCYANFNDQLTRRNYEAHDPASPLLSGMPPDTARISERPVKSLKSRQIGL